MRLLILLISSLLASVSSAQLATPDENGIAFGHVHLNVANIEEHLQLWTEFFGGEAFPVGSSTAIKFPNMLLVMYNEEPSMGSRETVMDHFGFKVRDIQAFREKWEAAGYEMDDDFTGAEGQINAYLTMPGGAYVELQEDQGLHEPMTGYHVHYRTEGHEELMQWYTELLGVEVRARGSIATTTNVPGMNLSFGGSNTARASTQGAAIDHVGFEIQNLEEFCRELEARGIEFDRPYSVIESIGLGTAFLTDPRGVRIELTEGLTKLYQ